MLKKRTCQLLGAVTFASLIATYAFAAPPTTIADTSEGKALTDPKGMTLYTFAKDTGVKSACNGPCANNWPALKADAGAEAVAPYSIIARDDGSKQWAYGGKPLYTFAKDTKAGETMGDGFLNGAWEIARP